MQAKRISALLLTSALFLPLFAEPPQPAEVLPAGALVYLEAHGSGRLVRQFKESALWKLVQDSPQYQRMKQEPNYKQANTARILAETFLGMNLWTLGEKLLGGQVAVGVYPRAGRDQPDAVVLIRVKDRTVLDELRKRANPLALLAGEDVKRFKMPVNVDLWQMKNGLEIATRDDWAVIAQHRPLLLSVLRGIGGQAPKPLAADPEFRAMTSKFGANHDGRAYVNLASVVKGGQPRLGIPEKLDDGGASFFIHGILELAARSPYLGLTLDATDEGFALTAGFPSGPKTLGNKFGWFFSNPATQGTRPLPRVPGVLGGVTMHRDFGGWYSRREELLAENLLPGFDQFETEIANVLPGRDFAEDVLPALGKTVTFIAAEQSFDHLDGKPGVKLPGFALIFDLAKPREGADLFQLVFQTIAALTNFGAAESGNEPTVMTAEVYKGTTLTTARYLKKPKGDRLPIVYNFMPCAASVGDKFIISSSAGTCRALIDALKKPAAGPAPPNRNFNFEIRPSKLADLAAANREALLAQSLQQGKPLQQARGELDLIQKMLRAVKLFRLSTHVKPDQFHLKLEGKW